MIVAKEREYGSGAARSRGAPYATMSDEPYVAYGTTMYNTSSKDVSLPLPLILISNNSASLRCPRALSASSLLRGPFGLLNTIRFVLPVSFPSPFPRLPPCPPLNLISLPTIPYRLILPNHAGGMNTGCSFMIPRTFHSPPPVHRDSGGMSS